MEATPPLRFAFPYSMRHEEVLLLKRNISCPTWAPYHQERNTMHCGLTGFWRHHVPHLLLLPIDQVTQKAAGFEWDLEQKKALQQVHAAVHRLLYHLSHMIQQTQWIWRLGRAA